MNSNEGLFGFIPTRQRKLLIISVSLLVAALLVLTALAITGEFTPITTPGASNPAQGEVKIWQEKEFRLMSRSDGTARCGAAYACLRLRL